MIILIVKANSQNLHDLEFVKPIEKILEESKIKFFTKHYSKLTKKDLKKAEKIIICGTSLQDNKFIKDINYFGWLKNYAKPVLGICAGMQIISLIFDAKIKSKTEIGFYRENFKENFLGLEDEQEVYHLHNNYVILPKVFEKFTTSKIPQAIKHKTKEIYGVLFHPEVRNKKLIEEFIF
jgi:GMP synthase-like glutamine amidotransferase